MTSSTSLSGSSSVKSESNDASRPTRTLKTSLDSSSNKAARTPEVPTSSDRTAILVIIVCALGFPLCAPSASLRSLRSKKGVTLKPQRRRGSAEKLLQKSHREYSTYQAERA